MKYWLKLITLLFFLFIRITFLVAQTYYIQGCIVNNNNEEISGLIDYRDWKFNPGTIKFIPGDDNIPLTYDPFTLRSFTVNNEKFISETVSVERIPESYDELKYDRKREISEEEVFLKVMVEGETSLFYYNEEKSGRHFYIKKGRGGEIIELKQYNAIVEIEGNEEVVVKDEYKDQLAGIMRDCSMILPLVHLADYSMKDLIELTDEYNKCMKSEVDYIAKLPSYEFELSLSAGPAAFFIDFYGSGSQDLTAAEFPVSIKPGVAVGLNIIFPFARKTLSSYNELGIGIYRTTAEVLWYVSKNDYENVEIGIGAANISLLTAIRYTYPAPGFKPFLYAGLVNMYSPAITNDKTSVVHFFTTDTENISEAIPGYRRYSPALAAGIGMRYKKIGIDLRYQRPGSISNKINVDSRINNVFLFFSYSF
ncbi:MAG TPA: hypothetical protein DEQ09_02410 [Bacteroidales bacterium]|nr:hypothetical protein [Bacteroidales bacterium]